MADVKVPELGENIDSGDVVKVSVAVGDTISKDQTIVELETDKAVLEVPSSAGGKVSQVHVKAGDKVSVGDVLLSLDAAGAEEPKEEKKAAPVQASKSEPEIKETKSEKPAQQKENQESKAKVETKTDDVDDSDNQSENVTDEESTHQEIAEPVKKTGSTKMVAASPSVRRFAREIGVDLDSIKGSGDGGRVLMDDVKDHARRVNTQAQPRQVANVTQSPALPDFTKWGDVERKPMSSVRRKTATHLTQAWAAPHVTQCDKADVTDLEKLRKKYADRAKDAGGRLTMTVIIMKVIASALKVFPQFNASVDMSSDEIIYKKFYNIGIAVDTDRGLLVPVVRDVQKKNIIQLSVELNAIAERARDKKLSLEDMQCGTFTISNLGGLGGTYFTPIINAPEVAILGVSRGQMEPIYQKDGNFEPRLMLPLSLSYDHRLIDGADAVRFLRWVCEALQQPFLMDLEG